eukprot:gene9630-1834_t
MKPKTNNVQENCQHSKVIVKPEEGYIFNFELNTMNYSEKPQPIQKKKSKTLGDKVGVWDEEEHALFMKGFNKYGRNWSQIAKEFCTLRTRQQVRSHAQKFFRKNPSTN